MPKEPKKLSHHAFQEATRFLRIKARPLEVSRFENIFNDSDVADILNELRKFQNADGGFGHALEPDLRALDSSVLCTSIAFQVIRDHQVPREEEIVQRGIRYLMDTLDQSELHWRIIPDSASTAPHAPWWNQKGREEEFRNFSLNPTAEILGYLLDYGGSVVDKQMTSQTADRVVNSLRSLKTVEMHDLLCCSRLLETKNLPSATRESVQCELKRLVTDTVATNPEQWKEYCLRPLQIIHHPNSPFMDGFKEAVTFNLDFEIKEQQDNGAWAPTWTWGDKYPESWKTAKREWSGVLTLDKLLILERFGRIEKRRNP